MEGGGRSADAPAGTENRFVQVAGGASSTVDVDAAKMRGHGRKRGGCSAEAKARASRRDGRQKLKLSEPVNRRDAGGLPRYR